MTLRRVLLGILALPVLLAGYCAVQNHDWWQGAEAAVRTSVTAVAHGRRPADLTLDVQGDSLHAPATDFRLPYTIAGVDNFPGGAAPADWLSPGVYVAHLRFENGRTYHVEAARRAGRWHVHVAPAEEQVPPTTRTGGA